MSGVRIAISKALGGAILALNHAHKLAVNAREFEIADYIETAVEAIEGADKLLKKPQGVIARA